MGEFCQFDVTNGGFGIDDAAEVDILVDNAKVVEVAVTRELDSVDIAGLVYEGNDTGVEVVVVVMHQDGSAVDRADEGVFIEIGRINIRGNVIVEGLGRGDERAEESQQGGNDDFFHGDCFYEKGCFVLR